MSTVRRFIRTTLLLLVVPFAVAAPVAGQARPGTLDGLVTDNSGAAVSAAAVTVRRPAAGFEQQATADDQGRFVVRDLPPGEYEVSAVRAGFSTTVARVVVVPGQTARLALLLRVGGVSEDVVVTGELTGSHDRLRRMPGAVDVLDRDTLERSRVMTTSEALRKVAGVHVRDEEGFGLRPNIGIRGVNPTRSTKVLLLEDGIPVTYAVYGDNASYYHPPIDRFERIEVLKGGAQIAYGPQTIGGAVNYVTPKPPSVPGGSVSFLGGNRNFLNAHGTVGGTFGRTGVVLDLMRKQGDGARENLDFRLNDVTLKVVQPVGSRQTWTLRGNYYGEDSTITYSGLREDEYAANPRGNPFANDAFYGDRIGTSATNASALGANAVLTTNVYWSTFKRHWWRQSSNSAQRPNDAADPLCGGMANLSTTCGNEGRLRQYHSWGVEPRIRVAHRLLGVTSETDFGVRAHWERQDRVQQNGATPTARAGVVVEDNWRTNEAYSGFVENRFLAGGWTITPGVRVEHVGFMRTNRLANGGLGVTGDTRLTRVIPGIGVAHTTGERVTLFAGAHRGFAPPRTEDIISNTGGLVDLDPELSWNYEAGVRSNVRPGVSVDTTFFRMDYDNQVVPASLAGGVGATLTNGGQTLHQGVELRAQVDTAPITNSAHDIYLRVAYTWLPTARFTGRRFSNISGFSGTSVSGNRLPYAPEQMAVVGVGYMVNTVDVMLEGVYTGAQFGDDLNTVTPTPDGQRGLLPSNTVVNATVNYSLSRSTLFVTVKNLFDSLYMVDRSRGILPGMPRLVQAGLRLRF